MSKRYGSRLQSIIHWREMAILNKLLKKAGGMFEKLLDCPCGYGRLTDNLSRRSSLLVSSDIDPGTLSSHSSYFKERIPKYADTPSDIKQLPFKDESFDGMVTFRLFHHLVDRESRIAVFSEAARVSRRFLLISYYRSCPIHKLSRKLNRNGSVRNGRKSFLDSISIMEEAASAGWMLVDCHRVLPVIHAQTVALFVKMG